MHRLPAWTRWSTIAGKVLVAGLAAATAAALWVGVSISRDAPVTYDDITEHFKYGSIGSEPGGSLLRLVGGALPPYWVFRRCRRSAGEVARRVCFASASSSSPARTCRSASRDAGGSARSVGFNCAICHTGTVRDAPGARAAHRLGMPSHQLDLQALVEFVLECSLDSRVTRQAVLAGRRMGGGGPSLFERLLFRFGLVDRLKVKSLDLQNADRAGAERSRAGWGRGRVDTFNPYKAVQFNWPLDRLPRSELIGATDLPVACGTRRRATECTCTGTATTTRSTSAT